MLKRLIRPVALLILAVSISPATASAAEDPWAAYRFLLGEWVGEGDVKAEASFALDLQQKILVRKNHAELPAAAGRPAGTHDDLMVVYQAAPGKPSKAIYFDSEGHVIQYTLTSAEPGQKLVLTSEASAPGPRFRLTYVKGEGDPVNVKFEIAPPGKPDGFKTYVEGAMRRKP